MKNYLKILTPVVLVLLTGSLSFIFAQTSKEAGGQFPKGERRDFSRRPPSGLAPNGLHPRLLEQLNLTDEQKQKIRTLEEKARSDSQVYFEKLVVVQEKIKDTTESEAFDEAQARALLKARNEIQTELEIIRLRADSTVYNLLTAEQIARLGILREQRPEFPPKDGFRPNVPPPQN